MKVDAAMVSHIAGLARLKISSNQTERFATQLSSILDYVEQLGQLDLSDQTDVEFADSCERDDVPGPSLSIEEALAAAPDATDRAFRVPKIIE